MAEDEEVIARRVALDAIRSWGRPTELVRFAQERHGYCNTDGIVGVTYPDDLDDYDRTMGASIPEGFVEVFLWYGQADGPTYQIPEETYLAILRQWLSAQGRDDLVQKIDTRPE